MAMKDMMISVEEYEQLLEDRKRLRALEKELAAVVDPKKLENIRSKHD